MSEVLLEQLTNQDIQWLRKNGSQRSLGANKVLISPNNPVNFLYIVMEGDLVASITKNQSSGLGRVFAALEDEEALTEEIASFSEGDVLGEMSFLDVEPSTTITAVIDCLILAIPRELLQQKLDEDEGFASRFYRAMAILLQQRLQKILQIYLKRKLGELAPLQGVPTLFGELADSDVDWMLRVGQLEAIATDEVLIKPSTQVENLYVILDGMMSVSVSEVKKNRLSRAFAALEAEENSSSELAPLGRSIARTSRGEILGEIAAFDSAIANYTIKALQDSLVLAIPRGQLLIKLQQDLGMASRFYRVLAILQSGRLQGLISRLGFGKSSYQVGQRLSKDIQYEDEIDLDVMDKLTLGGARFNWMLNRLKVS